MQILAGERALSSLYRAVSVLLVQFALIWFIWQNKEDERPDTSLFLQVVAIYVFGQSAWAHIVKNFQVMVFFMTWGYLLQRNPRQPWEARTFFFVDENNEEEIDADETEEDCTDAKHMASHAKTEATSQALYIVRALVVLPLVVCLVLWFVGCAFLVQSEGNDEMVLNATALTFILEMAEGVCPDEDEEEQSKSWGMKLMFSTKKTSPRCANIMSLTFGKQDAEYITVVLHLLCTLFVIIVSLVLPSHILEQEYDSDDSFIL